MGKDIADFPWNYCVNQIQSTKRKKEFPVVVERSIIKSKQEYNPDKSRLVNNCDEMDEIEKLLSENLECWLKVSQNIIHLKQFVCNNLITDGFINREKCPSYQLMPRTWSPISGRCCSWWWPPWSRRSSWRSSQRRPGSRAWRSLTRMMSPPQDTIGHPENINDHD